MQQRNSLQSILKGLGQLIGMFVVYFFIGAGWNGLYDMYCRSYKGMEPDQRKGERVGLIAFWSSIVITFLAVYFFSAASSEGAGIVLRVYFKALFIFFIVTLIGFVYFWKNLWK